MSSKRKHLSKIYLALIGVYLLGEIVIWLLPVRPYRTQMEILTDYQVERSESVGAGDVILLGDSSLGNAIDERQLSGLVGKPCHNLALVALFGPQADAVMLRHVLSVGEKPQAIVMMHAPQNWNHRGSDDAVADLVDQAGPLSLASVANSSFGQLPSVQRSRSYKSIFFSVRTGFGYNPNVYDRAVGAQDESTRLISSTGYIPQKRTISIPHKDPGDFEEFFLYPNAEKKIRETFELAKKRDIPVFIACGPFWEGRVRSAATASFIESLQNWLAELAADYDNVEFLYRGVPAAPDRFIGDTLEHLNDDGAQSFTEWFGPILKQRLAGEKTDPAEAGAWSP